MGYAWGSKHLIQDLTGLGEVGKPAAEVWFGSHPTSPSQIVSGGTGNLSDHSPELGFLVKFLAAEAPLSIQAHPSKARAQEQFALGNKSYSDANHKPELIIAITEFQALCGFRSLDEIGTHLDLIATEDSVFQGWLTAFASDGIEGAVKWAFENNLSNELHRVREVLGSDRATLVSHLSDFFPADVGIMISLLMEHVVLQPGEALFLPAGNIHAYVSGLGVEVMASSDNVLRGGLTQKLIDVPELMKVLDFAPIGQPRVVTRKLANGLTQYPADVSDFSVYAVEVGGANMLIDLELKGSMIALCTAGELEISTSQDEYLKISKGQAAFVSDSRLFSITGSGSGYLAMG